MALLPLLINAIHPNAIVLETLTIDGVPPCSFSLSAFSSPADASCRVQIKNAWMAMEFAAQHWPVPPPLHPPLLRFPFPPLIFPPSPVSANHHASGLPVDLS